MPINTSRQINIYNALVSSAFSPALTHDLFAYASRKAIERYNHELIVSTHCSSVIDGENNRCAVYISRIISSRNEI